MQTRLDDEIKWYSQKARHCQTMFKTYQIAEIILAALIPLLSSYAGQSVSIAFIIGLFGAVITIIESVTKLFKYHENWIHYRTTCELLKHQKYLYLTKSYPYNESDETIENLFVKNIEMIISAESSQWQTMNGTKKDDGKNTGKS